MSPKAELAIAGFITTAAATVATVLHHPDVAVLATTIGGAAMVGIAAHNAGESVGDSIADALTALGKANLPASIEANTPDTKK